MRTHLDCQNLDLAVTAEAAPEAKVVESHAVPQLKVGQAVGDNVL